MIELCIKSGNITGDLATKWNEKVKEKKKMEDLLKKAERGDVFAMELVAHYSSIGCNGFKKTREFAMTWFEKAHDAGSRYGSGRFGRSLLRKHPACIKGIILLSTAAGRGCRRAAYDLGEALAVGRLGLLKDKNGAIFWLRESLKDSDDQWNIADEYKAKACAKLAELESA